MVSSAAACFRRKHTSQLARGAIKPSGGNVQLAPCSVHCVQHSL